MTTEPLQQHPLAPEGAATPFHREHAASSHTHNDGWFRALNNALPSIVSTCDAAGNIDYFNDRWYEYTGLSEEESLARGWSLALHPDDYATAFAAWRESMETGQSLEAEGRVRSRDGAYRWHLARMEPIYQGNEITGWVLAAIDIHDRKQAEDYERFLSAISAQIGSLHDPSEIVAQVAELSVPTLADICSIGFLDRTPETIRVKTVGASEAERPYVEGIHLRRWLHQPGSSRTIADVIAEGLPVHVPELTPEWIDACAPDATQREIGHAFAASSLICLPLVVRGEAIGMTTFAHARSRRRYTDRDLGVLREVAARVGVAVDSARLVRDLRETAEHLRRANAAKDEFLGLVSHELKTPITMILGNAEVLERRLDELPFEARRDALHDIRHEAERLHRIIENLLVLARLERGQTLHAEPMLIRRVVERALRAHRRDFPRREIRTNWESDATVLASPDYVEQVLRNLLSNAEKYCPPDEPIEVVGRQSGDEAIVSVIDRGPGIPEHELELIFTPFYRSETTAAAAQGVGIGLTVCHRLIEAQGGRLWAHTREGGGTSFNFALKMLTDDADE